VEQALRHFRQSVHAWSEREIASARKPDLMSSRIRSGFFPLRMPVANWAAAAVLLVAAVAGPVAYRERAAKIEQQQHEAKILADKKVAEETAAKLQAYEMDDEELLKHVDSDVAQQTPDAMEPLASLMTDEKTN